MIAGDKRRIESFRKRNVCGIVCAGILAKLPHA